MKILIVEDDFDCRHLMQVYLKNHGECFVACNGYEAVAAFETAHEQSSPYDLICLDISMPGMDGHEALKRIRQIEKNSGIAGSDCVKVIMTTAINDRQSIIDAFFEEGCEAYIVKPIKKQKLLEEIEKLGLPCEASS